MQYSAEGVKAEILSGKRTGFGRTSGKQQCAEKATSLFSEQAEGIFWAPRQGRVEAFCFHTFFVFCELFINVMLFIFERSVLPWR